MATLRAILYDHCKPARVLYQSDLDETEKARGLARARLLWAFALSPLARHGDVWGLGPTLMFTLFMGPIFAAMPLRWYTTYRKQQRIMDGIEENTEIRHIEAVLE